MNFESAPFFFCHRRIPATTLAEEGRRQHKMQMGKAVIAAITALAMPVLLADRVCADNFGRTWSYAENNDGSIILTGVKMCAQGSITIPSFLAGRQVTKIDANAFKENAMITGVTIPGCIVSIGDFAFYGCPNLTELTIEEGVRQINGLDAFRYCGALKTITFPKGLTWIRHRAMRNCPKVVRLNTPSIADWLEIGFSTPTSNPMCMADAFLYANGVRVSKLIIPPGTKLIKGYAFMGAKGIQRVTIPGTVEFIGPAAFLWSEGGPSGNCDVVEIASDIGTVKMCCTILDKHTHAEMMPRPGYRFVGWEDQQGNLVNDPFHAEKDIVVTPRWEASGGGASRSRPSSAKNGNNACYKCRGSGVIAKGSLVDCSDCGGKGVIETDIELRNKRWGDGWGSKSKKSKKRETCQRCGRRGRIRVNTETVCPACNGTGTR